MFVCKKCGECCRNIGGIDVYKDLDRGDGICKFLEGNICSIYENRPLLCRVDESYEKLFASEISREDFYKLNYQVCEGLIKKGG